MTENPYQAPLAPDVAAPDSQDEIIRRTHLSHEASVKGFGSLCLIAGVGGMFLMILPLILMFFDSGIGTLEVLIFVVFGGVGVLHFIGGLGLRRLTRTGRVIGTIVAAIGLIGFPVVTLLSIYLLYLLWSAKGAMVFSPLYREVIDRTPHIRYRTSKWVWILLGLIVAMIAGLVFFAATADAELTPGLEIDWPSGPEALRSAAPEGTVWLSKDLNWQRRAQMRRMKSKRKKSACGTCAVFRI